MKFIILLFLFSFTLCSCNKVQERTRTDSDTEIPKVLNNDKEKSYDRLSSSSSLNLTDAIYEELMEKNSELKSLDENVKKNINMMNKIMQEYNQYTSKSTQYYADAENKAGNISDSIVRIKIIDKIKNSREKYNSLISSLNESDSTIHRTFIRIKDSYDIFKIQKTLPVIENYQKEKLFDNNKFKDFIKEQNGLLQKIK